MPLHVEVVNSMSGASILPVEAAAAPANRRLVGSGDCAFVFKLADLYERLGGTFAQAKAIARDQLFKPRARAIMIHDGGSNVLYSGFIMKRGIVDDEAGTLTLNTNEFRIASSWRMTAGVNQVRNGNLKATGKSPSAALRLILQRMMNGDAAWQFPLDLSVLADGPGNIDVDANWYDTLQIEDLLQSLEERGYEIDFNPERTSSGALRIVPRIAPVIQTTAITDFSVGAAKSAITNLKVDEDATQIFTGVLGAGGGSGSDTPFAFAGNSGSTGYPIADVRRDFGDMHSMAALQQATDAEFARYADLVEQWSFGINLDAAGLGWEHVAIGRRVRLDVRGHWWIPDGQYVKRIIARKTGLNGNVSVEVQ